MSDLTTIRNAIVALLEGVAGIGRVHAYERYATNDRGFRDLYDAGAGKILGWHVRRVATRDDALGVGAMGTTHTWRVVGIRALEDAEASELELDDLVERIRAAGRDDDTLAGAVATITIDQRAGFELVDSGPVMFAGVLCHRVVLKLTTVHDT
jgi:hypothetical protein